MSSANTDNRYRKVAFAFQHGEEKAGQIMIDSHVGGEERRLIMYCLFSRKSGKFHSKAGCGNILISCGAPDIFDSGSSNGMVTVKYGAAMTIVDDGRLRNELSQLRGLRPAPSANFPSFRFANVPLAIGSGRPCELQVAFPGKNLSWQIVQHYEKISWSRTPFDFPAVQNCM